MPLNASDRQPANSAEVARLITCTLASSMLPS